ncbi:hypothetical protein CPC08DRAFT_606964, partial [Agrocybe pediades]
DLAFNPFADEESGNNEPERSGSSSTLVQASTSSAFFPNSSSRPTLRRRRSSLSSKRAGKGDGSSARHTRFHTEIEIPPYSAGLHPLKTALAGINGTDLEDLSGVTRPHLLRIVNDANLGEISSTETNPTAEQSPSSPDQEKEVIVHQVTSKDSLAGVALKYGISLPNLRRANKLWTSDSIHLRNVLYIPIEQASRAREYIPEPEPDLISFTPDAQITSSDPFNDLSSPISLTNSNSDTSVPVRKIPIKQLSFFPPSSHKINQLASVDPERLSQQLTIHGNSRQSPGSSKYSPSHVNNSLSSILTALPINASTRDEIITRLSFDSVSSSFSDRSRTNSDEDKGHELAEVSRRKALHIHAEDLDEISLPTPKASQPPRTLPRRSEGEVGAPPSLSRTPHSRSYSSTTSPPRFYVSQPNETYVRTSQLEPSPAMQLP